MDAIRTYDYLERTRCLILDAVRSLSPAEYNRDFEIGLGRLDRVLTHIAGAEWYYLRRMRRETIPPFESWTLNWENHPELAVIEKEWRALAEETKSFIASVQDWDAEFQYRTNPDPGEQARIVTVTLADLFTQLAFHEVHHRSQLMTMLRQLGKPVGDIDFNTMMYTWRPAE